MDQNHRSLEIEVRPPQAQDLADPQTEAQGKQHDGSIGLNQYVEYLPSILYLKDARTFLALADAGTIEEVKLPPKGSEKEIAYLLVKSGANTVDVYVCPQSFLAEMGVSFNKGDEISLTGSKVKQGEADLMLAREVVRGNDTVVLRDEKGNPVWSGRR